MKERVIEAYLVKRVKALGGEVRKVQFIGRTGAPDRLVMLPQREKENSLSRTFNDMFHPTTIWVELKAPGEKAKAHQVREHERMRRMGQRVEVIDSIEGVDALLA